MKKLLVSSLSAAIAILMTANSYAQWGGILDPPKPLRLSFADSGYIRTPSDIGPYPCRRGEFGDIVIDTGSPFGDSFLDRHVGAEVYYGSYRYRLYKGFSNGTYVLKRYPVEIPELPELPWNVARPPEVSEPLRFAEPPEVPIPKSQFARPYTPEVPMPKSDWGRPYTPKYLPGW